MHILRRHLAKVLVIGVMPLFMVGCQKEGNGGMQLIAESFGSTKTAVDGVNSYWVDGETIRINGVNKTVVVEGTSASISDVAEASVYRALYPDTLNSSADLASDNVSVLIPHTYTYKENSNGLQRLGVPMAACGTGSSRLYFQHLTAALTVEIKNIYGFTIEVDSVVVVSDNYQISGNRDITLSDAISVAAVSSDIAADKRVKVCFDGGTSLQILAGQTRRVQVPVLPVGDDNHFTIRIGVHKVDDSNVQCIFNRTQGDSKTSRALERNQMGFAGVTFGKAFSVSATKKVILAQGNLQYLPSENEWSFHSHQYDVCEVGPIDSTTRYIASGTLPIDLFGFGTSGYNNMYPYMTNMDPTAYVAPASSIAKTDYDWGWHNAISNGGNEAEQWYSLPYDQWKYLFNSRPTSIAELRYTYATINGTHKGIILFPDNYSQPNDVTLNNAIFNNPSGYTAVVSSYSDWNKMEAAGAVFLPAAAERSLKDQSNTGCYKINEPSYGMYWTGSGVSSDAECAYRIRFISSNTYSPNILYRDSYRYNGMSVRLAKDL